MQKIQHAEEVRARKMAGKYVALNRNWTKREERIRLDIIKDLIKFDLLTCKPVSQRRSTSLLPSTIDARRDVGEQPTVTMPTDREVRPSHS